MNKSNISINSNNIDVLSLVKKKNDKIIFQIKKVDSPFKNNQRNNCFEHKILFLSNEINLFLKETKKNKKSDYVPRERLNNQKSGDDSDINIKNETKKINENKNVLIQPIMYQEECCNYIFKHDNKEKSEDLLTYKK